MDRTAQWINDVSAIPVHSQLEDGSTRSDQCDIGAKCPPFSVSPRRPRLSRTSIRGQIEGSRSSSSGFNDSDCSGPFDEQLDLEAAFDEPGPDDLDDPWPYTFQMGDSVWIRTEGGNWHPGKVSSTNVKQGPTRQKEGLFYPVIFRKRIRKHFAPLNGEIKPDTPRTRILLRRAGWL
ncbi:hypothetical protein BJV78DRAFT_1239756 [Lactifluus subvellereus]|nr:hypothetical protein BJV78DRAFT_1239756 [Lactifluus subvellereus]